MKTSLLGMLSSLHFSAILHSAIGLAALVLFLAHLKDVSSTGSSISSEPHWRHCLVNNAAKQCVLAPA